MSESARERIFASLRAAVQTGGFTVPATTPLPDLPLSREERIERLQRLMEAMHTEVYRVHRSDWLDTLKGILNQRTLNQILYAPGTPIGEALEKAWDQNLPPLVPYTEEIEQFKEKLFAIDAGITSTKGGIAETGALILWPSAEEPRLMSLVPSIHIAVLEADRIHSTFAEAIASERWQDGMPTNALLISGPSKTADIELTLTFGVHGPKELILLIIED